MLAIIINRAKEDGQVDGLIHHLVEGGVSILQYADDVIIFMEHDLEKALNMKLILCLFEQLSGLKKNFRVKYFVLVKLKRLRISIDFFSDVRLGIFRLNTLAFQFIFVSLKIVNGNRLRIGLRGS
jgi:hypothetical protein